MKNAYDELRIAQEKLACCEKARAEERKKNLSFAKETFMKERTCVKCNRHKEGIVNICVYCMKEIKKEGIEIGENKNFDKELDLLHDILTEDEKKEIKVEERKKLIAEIEEDVLSLSVLEDRRFLVIEETEFHKWKGQKLKQPFKKGLSQNEEKASTENDD